ncbi:MAG: hypothetical protein ACREE4_17285 [Stellaceae bacterium]
MIRPTGRIRLWRNGALFCERRNLVVNAGLPAFAETASGATAYQVAAVGFGSGNTAPSVNDTDLGGPLKYYNAVGAATFPSSGTVQFAFAIQAADYAAYGETIQELGLFSNSAAVTVPAVVGFSYSAWAASSNQPVGNLVKDSAGHPFRSTTPPAWVASKAVVVGQLITDSNSNIQQCTVAGTTGGSHPTWSATIGDTVADGGATWKCVALSGYTPVTGGSTPSWNTGAIGDFTWDNTVAWVYLAALVIPSPMIAHAVVPSFAFTGSGAYSGSWSLTF